MWSPLGSFFLPTKYQNEHRNLLNVYAQAGLKGGVPCLLVTRRAPHAVHRQYKVLWVGSVLPRDQALMSCPLGC